jgi:leucyl aminopeptidase
MGSAKTHFNLTNERITGIKADGVIIPVFKKTDANNGNKSDKKADKNTNYPASIVWPLKLDKALLDEINTLAMDEKFDGGKGKLLTIRTSNGNKLAARRLIILGLGEADKLQAKYWESNLRKAYAAVLGLNNAKSIAVLLPDGVEKMSAETALSLAVDAAYQATYKSMEAKENNTDLQTVMLVSQQSGHGQLNAALEQATVLAQARSLVKDLVNHPSNLKSTNTLVEQAKAIGKNSAIKVTVQSDSKWIEKNMPCFYTVARGSVATDPPKFITLQYQPKSGKAKKHIAIVGKSVIFDTGGYQVKPGDYMVTMKGDMTGGAVALATMQALAALQPQHIAVSAYLAATPNKIDSDAMIPDSIVNTTCGKKVEIRHTDAEGRLTLIDAVAKAVENKPDEIITIATLTGSASQAVGYYIALMGNNEALRDRIQQAGKSLAEPIQTLDVNDDDYENIKSKLDGADIINTSQRKHRGAQSAAAFVMSGAPDRMPMAHLDIAGADMTADEKATGVSVKTIIQYLLNEDAALNGGARKVVPAPAKSAKTTVKPASKASAAKTVASKTPASKTKAKTAKATATAPAKAKPGVKTAAKPKKPTVSPPR